jgi:integrase
MHPRLKSLLDKAPRSTDGYIFRNSRGGKLNEGTARTWLTKHVLKPLALKFPSTPGVPGFANGTLHSFRHYFISECVAQKIAERVILDWVGHSSSAILQLYYTQRTQQSADQMNNLRFGNAESEKSA